MASIDPATLPATLDDTTLAALQQSINAESTRRAQLATCPQAAITACWQYKAAGGNPQDVVDGAQAWVTNNP